MSDKKSIEERLHALEERVKKLEEIATAMNEEKQLMEEYYVIAKRVVVREQKASIIFLQRKLLIDFDRAKKLLGQLEENGIIGPEEGSQPRKVLVKE